MLDTATNVLFPNATDVQLFSTGVVCIFHANPLELVSIFLPLFVCAIATKTLFPNASDIQFKISL